MSKSWLEFRPKECLDKHKGTGGIKVGSFKQGAKVARKNDPFKSLLHVSAFKGGSHR